MYDGRWRRGPRAGHTDLVAVSCTGVASCMAVDTRSASHLLRGGAWVSQGDVFPVQRPTSISCPTSSLCMATSDTGRVSRWNGHGWKRHRVAGTTGDDTISCSGPHFCALAAEDGRVATWTGGWTRLHRLKGLRSRRFSTAPQLSCPRPHRCLAVGAGDNKVFVLHHGWHRGPSYEVSDGPSPTVSCSGGSFCMAFDGLGRARTFDGTGWTATHPTDSGATSGPVAVSCTSKRFCAAVDRDGDAMLWDGASWSPPQHLASARDWAVDCASVTYCLAIESQTDGAPSSAFRWNGATWAAMPLPARGTASVQCAAADDCWIGSVDGYVSHFDGATWSFPRRIVDQTDDDGFNNVDLSCPSTTFCAASDDFGNVSYFRGSTWSTLQQIGHSNGISCASSTSCTALLDRWPGHAIRYDGSSWTTSRALPPGYDTLVTGLSCATSKDCMAVDLAGNAYERR